MEVLDVYDENGKALNKTVLRGADDSEFASGEHIAVSIIFIENDKGEFLIQKLPSGKYSSTGGHVLSKEKPMDAIIRETKEEIGLTLEKKEIVDFGFKLFDFPVRFLYYIKKNVDLDTLVLDKNEVSSVSYMSEEKINRLIEDNRFNKGHAILFREILKYKYGTKSLNDLFTKYSKKYKVKYAKKDPRYFKLIFKNNKYKYKLFISNDSIEVFRKEKLLGIKGWYSIENIENIEGYNDLEIIIDSIIKKYGGKR